MTYFQLRGSESGRGQRLLQICRFWSEDNKLIIFSSESAIKGLENNLGVYRSRIEFKATPFSASNIKSRLQVIRDYIKKIFLSPFVDIAEDADIVYTLTALIPDCFYAFVQKIRHPKIKWVANVDNLVWFPWERPGWRRLNNFIIYSLARFSFMASIALLKKADLIFTVSNGVSKGLVNFGLSENKIMVSSNGIVFEEITQRAGKNSRIFDAVYLGRIEIAKGILDLIDAWQIVCMKDKGLKLALVGGMVEAMEKRLNKILSERDLKNNIEILGFRGGSEKFDILNKSKVFASASYDESFGQAVMEALACGLPVVAYDLEAYREIYPDNLIQVVPKGRVDLLAEKILALIDDASLREKLSEMGRQAVKDKDYDKYGHAQEAKHQKIGLPPLFK